MSEYVERARAIPGASDAAVSLQLPTLAHAVSVDAPDGTIREMPAPNFNYTLVTPGYFSTFNLPLAVGRSFSEGAHDQPAVIVDDLTGAYLWPYANPVGRRLRLGPAHSAEPWIPVQGVLSNRRSPEARDVAAIMLGSRVNRVYRVVTPTDSVAGHRGVVGLTLTIRAKESAALAVAARRTFHDAGAYPPLVQPMVERLGMSNQIAAARFGALVASIFAIIATGLAALGVYSVVVQSTVDRQREIAVRVALGANARHVVRILIRDGNVFVLGGLLLGLILTVVAAKWLGVDEVFESKGLLLGAIIGCLFTAMAVAGLLPAYRATRLAPMEVLRAD
jgi:hypothetical protein